MKDYKIDAFDTEELQKWFDISKSEKSIQIIWLKDFIFQLSSSDKEKFYVYENILHQEFPYVLEEKNKKYIDEFWELYSEEELRTSQWLYTDWREDVDEEGNITVNTFNFPNFRELSVDYYDISSGNMKKVTTANKNCITYIADTDLTVLVNKRSEGIYHFLKELWVEISSYSGTTETRRQIDSANWAINEYGFIFAIPNKEKFINHCIGLLEVKLQNSDSHFAVQKRQELLMNEIEMLNKKYWTLWKDICVTNKNKTKEFETILILLFLKGKINIPKFRSWKKEYYLDILEYWKDTGIYFDKSNWDIFLNGEKLWTLPINNREFKFFEFLYENIWQFKTHKEVKEAIIWQDRISWTLGNYLSGVKKNLPDTIKDLIQSPSGWYMIKKI